MAVNMKKLSLSEQKLDTHELQSVGGSIKVDDYGFYTRSNGTPAGAKLIAPTVVSVGSGGNRPHLFSSNSISIAFFAPVAMGLPIEPLNFGEPTKNYRNLRDTDDRYWINCGMLKGLDARESDGDMPCYSVNDNEWSMAA